MLHWWHALLVLALTWRAHLVPPTPRQRATDPRVMHRDDVQFDGDVIEGDLVHPDGIID